MSIDHTEAFKKGIGIGALLVEAANEYAINHKLKVLPICSYASARYQRHPHYKDILDDHAGEGVSCQI